MKRGVLAGILSVSLSMGLLAVPVSAEETAPELIAESSIEEVLLEIPEPEDEVTEFSEDTLEENEAGMTKSCGENLTYRFEETEEGTTLVISGSGPMDDYNYNDERWFGNAKSNNIPFKVINAEITKQPTYQPFHELGETIKFSVSANNAASFQWYYSKDGDNWFKCTTEGSATDTLSITVTSSNATRLYRCKVTGDNGKSETSEAAGLIGFIKQPVDVNAAYRDQVTFSVTAVHAAAYQWYYSKDGANWFKSSATGNDTDSITIEVTSTNACYQYRCIITGSNGKKVTSSSGKISILPGAVVTAHPKDCMVEKTGDTATFTVVAEHASAYQWYYSEDQGNTWNKSTADGNTTDSLSIKVKNTNIEYEYRCQVTGENGNTVYSESAGMIKSCGENLTYTIQETEEGTTLVISGSGSMNNYTNYDEKWFGNYSFNKVVIEDGVTSIGSYAFYTCKSLSSVVIPDSVTSIGAYAFAYCNSLSSVEIPDSVTDIGYGAFKYCRRLNSIVISDSITSIGSWVFSHCSQLTSVVLPDSVTSIGSCAFYYCNSLSNIEIPDSVTDIGSCAFYNCNSLSNIEIPDSVTSIGYNAFMYCSSLTSVVIPDSVTSIGDYVFSGCSSLTSVVIPDSVTSIGYKTFYGCNKLTIYGEKNSYAQTYAKSNNILFEVMNAEITKQPKDQIFYQFGDTVNFSVAANNATSYQWYYSKDGSSWYKSTATGNTSDTLSLKISRSNSSNMYRCVVTGPDGKKVKSDIAKIVLKS